GGGRPPPEVRRAAAATAGDVAAMHRLPVRADGTVTLPADRARGEGGRRWLDARRREWEAAGIAARRILFDPGIGFGKNPLQSLELLRNVRRLHGSGFRCLVGHSRKSFMAGLTKRSAADRDLFTIGASLNLCAQGVDV